MSAPIVADLFAGLPATERAALERRLTVRRHAAGAIVLQQGGLSGELHIIRGGTFEVRALDPLGQATVLTVMGEHQCFGEMSLLTGQPHSASVVATTPAETAVLAREDFLALVEGSAQLAQNLSRLLSQRLYRATRHQTAAARATVIAVACPTLPAAAPILGLNLAVSLARQTRRPVLLATDAATLDAALGPLAAFALPALDVVARDGVAAAAHRDAPPGHRALHGARLCALHAPGVAAPPDPAWLDELAATYGFIVLAPAADAGDDCAWARGAGRALVAAPRGQVAEARVARAVAALAAACTPPDIITTDHAAPPAVAERGARSLPGLAVRLATLPDEPLPPLVRRARDGAAAAAIDLIARDIAGLKVGLALGAGSARGFAHIGALRVLERAGVPVDVLAGTSIGSVVAAGWACGHSVEHVAMLMRTIGPKVLTATVPYSSLSGNGALRTALRRMTGERLIEELPLPFAAVAVDLATQEPVTLTRGKLWEAVLASAAVPGIFPPVPRDGRWLIDGVVREPLPTRAVASLGGEIIIGVRLSPARNAAATGGVVAAPTRPNLLDIMLTMVDTMQEAIESHGSQEAHLIIHPTVSKVTLRNFDAGEALIAAGEAATEEMLPALRKHLPWLAEDCA